MQKAMEPLTEEEFRRWKIPQNFEAKLAFQSAKLAIQFLIW